MLLFIAFILILVFVYLYYVLGKPSSIPHGCKEIPIERGLPIIGILLQIEPPLPFYLRKLGEKLGSLFRIKLGLRNILILNNYYYLKKILSENGNNSSGRSQNKVLKLMIRDCGILFNDGEVWAKQRAFVLRVLRDFGLGKSRSAEIVQSECERLLDEIEQFNGKGVDFSEVIPIYTANIISKFIMNVRFSRGDPRMSLIDKVIVDSTKKRDIFILIATMFPIFDHSTWLAKCFTIINSGLRMTDMVHTILQDEIKKHISKLDLNSEGEDLIDRFLIEQHKLKEKTGSVDTFTDWQLVRNAFELFGAGYETTSTTLGWSMMFMARYPDIQNRVYKEIVDKIGTERLPTMNDKKSLSYTQAVMDEIFRLSTVAPLAIFHRSIEDISIDGYFIPRNTVIIPNLLACHTDPKIWKKPMEFYPEHFLLSNENGEEKYNCREELIPFGIGKRQCLGESLARMEYLIFFLSIIQRFEIQFVEEIDDERYKNALIGENGFNRFCDINRFIFIKRL